MACSVHPAGLISSGCATCSIGRRPTPLARPWTPCRRHRHHPAQVPMHPLSSPTVPAPEARARRQPHWPSPSRNAVPCATEDTSVSSSGPCGRGRHHDPVIPFAGAGAQRTAGDRVSDPIVQPGCSPRSAIRPVPAVSRAPRAPNALATDLSAPPACPCYCPGTSSRGREERTESPALG